MKTTVVLTLLLLVVSVSTKYNMIRSPGSPFQQFPSQDLMDLLAETSGNDFNVFGRTTRHGEQERSQTLLDILKRTKTYNTDGYIPTDKYSFIVHEQSKRKRACDTRRISIATILEYLRSGRICGFRVSTFRFGLGGKK